MFRSTARPRLHGRCPPPKAVARATGATLRLLAVAELQPEDAAGHSRSVRACLAMTAYEALERQLHVHARLLQERGVMTAVRMADGEPVAAIVAAAAEPDVSMVVMAPRGAADGASRPPASVTEAVLRAAARPVLLAPAAKTAAIFPARVRTLLLPLDGSAAAEAALPVAVALATAARARLLLVRVQQWLTSILRSGLDEPGMDEIEGQLTRATLAYLTEIRRRLPAELAVDVRAPGGVAAVELARLAHTEPADLIVMTTHGRGDHRRTTLGRTAAGIIEAGLPTLLIPAEAPLAPAVEGTPARDATRSTPRL